MEQIFDSVLALVGDTPLVRLHRIEAAEGSAAALYAKLEFRSPTRSSADRAVGAALAGLEDSGTLGPGGPVAALARGNEAIALAQWATVKRHPLTVVLAGPVSREQRKLLGGYAVTVLPSSGDGYEQAREAAQRQGAYFVDLIAPAAGVRRLTIGAEIWDALEGSVDVLAGPAEEEALLAETGGFLLEKDPQLQIVSAVAEGGHPAGESAVSVSKAQVRAWVRALARREGILAGPSSGAALAAAAEAAKKPENAGRNVVVLLPDTGERHLSTGDYEDILLPPELF